MEVSSVLAIGSQQVPATRTGRRYIAMHSGESLALLLVHEQHNLVLPRREDLADLKVVGDDALVVQDVPAFGVTAAFFAPEAAHVDYLRLGEGAEKGAPVVLVEDRDADQVCRQLHGG